MGSGCRGCSERKGSQSGAGVGRIILEGSGSNAPQYACPFHSAFERAHRARGWLRAVARRSVGSRSYQIEKITANRITERKISRCGLQRKERRAFSFVRSPLTNKHIERKRNMN